MTILLDTSVIIDILRSLRGRQEFLDQRKQAGDSLACSAVNVAEVYAGMRPNEAAATEAFIDSLECIEVTQEIARQAGRLKYAWERKGVTIDIPDAIIAATSLNFNLCLATDNLRHFPMPDLMHLNLPAN
jgi:predicted nucleic acid-binding protein